MGSVSWSGLPARPPARGGAAPGGAGGRAAARPSGSARGRRDRHGVSCAPSPRRPGRPRREARRRDRSAPTAGRGRRGRSGRRRPSGGRSGRRRSSAAMIAPGRRSKSCAISAAIRSSGIVAGAERVGVHGQWMRDADGVRQLQLEAPRQPGRHHVLGHVARHVGGGSVDLGRVLAGEAAAAVAGHAAVGVDDDLAAGEARIPHRPAGHEAPGRVDQDPGSPSISSAGMVGADDDLADRLLQLLRGDLRVVLGADQRPCSPCAACHQRRTRP